MTSASALVSVKNRLGITGSTFDAVLTDFIASSVKRLFPTAGYEVSRQEVSSFTLDDYGECEINLLTLTTPAQLARKVEYSTGAAYLPATDFVHHGSKLYVRDLPSSTTNIRVYGITTFTLHATLDANTTIYEWLELAVIWYAMSEFYDYLAGSKSRYNTYSQMPAARTVENMADESAYYEQKAKMYIQDQSTSYGG